MFKTTLPIDQILTLLTASPQRLATLTADLTPAQLQSKPTPDDWSANDILAHLRACADIWGGCITTILAEDHPTIRAINPRSWIKRTDYRTLDFATSLDAYTVQRTNLLALLTPCLPASWSRTATVTHAGSPLQRTLIAYAQRLARHEQPHLKHIALLVTTLKTSPTPDVE